MNQLLSGISRIAVVVVLIVIIVVAASGLYLIPSTKTASTSSIQFSSTESSSQTNASTYAINSSVTALSNSSITAASSSSNFVPTGQLPMEFSYPGTLLVSSDLSSLNYTVKFDALGNVPGSVTLKVIAPPNLSASFFPENLTLASQNTAELQVSPLKSTLPGNYQIRMVASGDGATYAQNETIQVVKNLVVTLGSFFLPRNLTISQGDTITWLRLNGALSQYDDRAHDVVFSASSFSVVSPTLVQYQVWSYVFNQTGNFNYYCKYHPLMTGTITVVSSP